MRASLTLVLLLAACGDDGHVTPDARPDVAADASTRVSITVVLGSGAPAPNIDVVFHDAAGEPLATSVTDATGVAFSDEPGIAMVTTVALNPDDNSREARTIFDVAPGDSLSGYVNFGYTNTPSVIIGSLAITMPPNPPSGTDTYKLQAMCGAASTAATSFTYTVYDYCARGGAGNTIDVYALALQGTTPLAYVPATGLSVTTSGATTLDLSATAWRTDWATYQSDYTNLPAGTTAARPEFTISVMGTSHIPGNPPNAPATPGTTVSHTFDYPMDLGVTNTYATLEVQYGTAAYAIYTKAAVAHASDTVDAGATLLPRVLSATTTDGTTVRPRVMFTTAAPETAADSGSTALTWATGNWSFMFPPTLTSVQVPVLPESLAAFRPPSDNSISPTAYVGFSENSFIDGYAGAKADRPETRPVTNYTSLLTGFIP